MMTKKNYLKSINNKSYKVINGFVILAVIIVAMQLFSFKNDLYNNLRGSIRGLRIAIFGTKYGFRHYTYAKAEILGRYLNRRYPGQKALIICQPGFHKNERTEKIIKFLAKGLGGKNRIVAEAIKIEPSMDIPGSEGKVLPLEEIMTATDFEKIVASHPCSSIIISLIGIPQDKEKLVFWNNKNKHFALFYSNLPGEAKNIKSGRIIAAVSFKPNIKFTDDPVPADPQKAFDTRYLLVTPENISEIKKNYPNLFK